VLVLHVSACGASTLSPVGDPPPSVFFSQIGHYSKTTYRLWLLMYTRVI